MTAALRRHDALVRAAIEKHRGHVFKALGDAFCAAFSRPADALGAMLDAQLALAREDFSAVEALPVRVAIHTGTADERQGDYFGPALNRVARLLEVSHGGQILCSAATAGIAQSDLPARASLRDLGEHALRDLDVSERIFQLLAPGLRADFPPLRAAGASLAHLPQQLTSFVGRERELADIAALLSEHRLVTLTGSGGVGKTQTALHVAADAAQGFAGGAWFVDLAPLTSGEHVVTTIVHTTGISLPAGDDALEALGRALKAKRLLLVLDNCEHLVADVSRVATALLRVCPNVKILASSRQPLEVAGEQIYRLPSLDTASATELFVQRARTVDESFALAPEHEPLVAEICDRLDGIPLAIELAASRAAVLSPKQISEKLDERFRLLAQKGGDRLPRQQTLRALIDWSFELLDQDERLVFARLSAFAGGWTLAAAATVCADDAIDEWQMLDVLSALVAKSLVVSERSGGDDRRYRLLNSIRDYSQQRLADSGRADSVAARHAGYFASLVKDRAPLVAQLEDERWQRELAPEVDNIRGAIAWSLGEGGDGAVGIRLLAHLEWPELVATPQEAVRWYDAASSVSGACVDDVTRARVLRHHVRLQWLVGRSTSQLERGAVDALAVARASGDANETAHALALLASAYRDAQRFDDAERLFAQAYGSASELSPIALNALLRNWAVADLQRGEIEHARQRFSEVARRERPGSEAHASALLNIGELEFAVGNVDEARAVARQARTTFERLDAAPLGLVTCNLAAYALAVDDVVEARELLRQALDLLKRTGARWTLTALEHAALLAALTSDHERAASLVGYTTARYADDDTRQTTERIGYERVMGLLHARYAAADLALRLEVGARLGDEQALESASAILETAPTRPADPSAEKRE